jgi:hypothetical protein
MSKSKQYFIRSRDDLKARFNAAYQAAVKGLDAGTVVLTLGRETRSNLQNAKMWAMLDDLAAQVNYCGKLRNRAAWKDICSVAWQDECELVMSLDNTKLIAVGLSTSALNMKQFAEFIEVIYVTGARFNVMWSEKAISVIDEYNLS